MYTLGQVQGLVYTFVEDLRSRPSRPRSCAFCVISHAARRSKPHQVCDAVLQLPDAVLRLLELKLLQVRARLGLALAQRFKHKNSIIEVVNVFPGVALPWLVRIKKGAMRRRIYVIREEEDTCHMYSKMEI